MTVQCCWGEVVRRPAVESHGNLNGDAGDGSSAACARVADVLPGKTPNVWWVSITGLWWTLRVGAVKTNQARGWNEVRRTGIGDALAGVRGPWE